MTLEAQGVHRSSGTAAIGTKLQKRKGFNAYEQLTTGNAFDFAKQHPELNPELMAAFTNAKTNCAGGW